MGLLLYLLLPLVFLIRVVCTRKKMIFMLRFYYAIPSIIAVLLWAFILLCLGFSWFHIAYVLYYYISPLVTTIAIIIWIWGIKKEIAYKQFDQ